MRRVCRARMAVYAGAVIAACFSGCTSLRDYLHNDFKVGPKYCPPAANVAPAWIDAKDSIDPAHANDPGHIHQVAADLGNWWTVFKDPVLDRLVQDAYRQNLTLKEAGCRILEARAQLGIARGEVFPQSQNMNGAYKRLAAGGAGGPVFTESWNYGFSLAWELDFWGRFRRAVASAEDSLQASVEAYDQVLVTLLADVATNYVLVRQFQEEIALAEKNVELQDAVLDLTLVKWNGGAVSILDVYQAKTNLSQTQAAIPLLKINLRQAQNQLCILLGMPPQTLDELLKNDTVGSPAIPTAPPNVAVALPAELLRRRPDVRQAERLAAAQAEQIGIAEAEFYPHISLLGNLGYSAAKFPDLFHSAAFNGSIGPAFQWDILQYGRLLNNVRLQDATFQERVLTYRQTVLQAEAEAENGIVTFLEAHQRALETKSSRAYAEAATNVVFRLYKGGKANFTAVAQVVETQVQVQDTEAQSRGLIAQGLIQVYRALGGGWQIRLPEQPTPLPEQYQTPRAPRDIVVPEIKIERPPKAAVPKLPPPEGQIVVPEVKIEPPPKQAVPKAPLPE